MSLASRLVISLQKRLTRFSIFWRIAIWDSLIIGAVCGTLLANEALCQKWRDTGSESCPSRRA
ncbi:MAG: hypothetical protein Q7U34_09930 [Anaerolineales bacterium]|nr:hypothetical protein [Anaerolineales bacterium]MDP3184391.1 hypothetical protein [Anaerolineales bacterium]